MGWPHCGQKCCRYLLFQFPFNKLGEMFWLLQKLVLFFRDFSYLQEDVELECNAELSIQFHHIESRYNIILSSLTQCCSIGPQTRIKRVGASGWHMTVIKANTGVSPGATNRNNYNNK